MGSGAFFACYFVIVLGILIGKKRIRQLMLATGCLAVVAELVINYNLTGLDTISRTDYVKKSGRITGRFFRRRRKK